MNRIVVPLILACLAVPIPAYASEDWHLADPDFAFYSYSPGDGPVGSLDPLVFRPYVEVAAAVNRQGYTERSNAPGVTLSVESIYDSFSRSRAFATTGALRVSGRGSFDEAGGDFLSIAAWYAPITFTGNFSNAFFEYTIGVSGSFENFLDVAGPPSGAWQRYTASKFEFGVASAVQSRSTEITNQVINASIWEDATETEPEGPNNRGFWLSEFIDRNNGAILDSGSFSENSNSFITRKSYNNIFTRQIPVSAGQTVVAYMNLTCASGRGFGFSAGLGPGDAECDFGQSAYWLGGRLVDALGAPVAGSFSSPTGFDFSKASPLYPGAAAVPEPGSWAMLVAGFGLVGLASRRRANPRSPTKRYQPQS